MRLKFIPVVLSAFFATALSTLIHGQSFPTGFSQVEVAAGIANPTVMAFSAGGARIFVAQQNGVLHVIRNGVKLTTPALTLSVNSSGERGLIGIALDPAFETNSRIYIYYTLPNGLRNRVSRFTFSGDVINPSSEVILLELDPLSTATNHNGGAMHFMGTDKLFIAVGDNANAANSQNLDTYHGKLLRINSDGSAPTDNPFYSATATNQRKRVWSWGLRNPFTFDIQSSIYVNDVGQNAWEEINDATIGGRNFGWPATEGATSDPAYVTPGYAYPHGSGDGRGCAITGGVFLPSTTSYPAGYHGKYFFQDLCNAWINYIDVPSGVRHAFATGLPGQSLVLDVGYDGNLYYLSRSAGKLYKIIYNNVEAPTISDQPDDLTVSVAKPAAFSVTATGAAPLSYQWKKDGDNISGATSSTYQIASAQPFHEGQYSVVVSNAVGSVASNAARLTVTANSPPRAYIQLPEEGTLYIGGQSFTFRGFGQDDEPGNPEHTWRLDFHHGDHMHPGPALEWSESEPGVSEGSFVIPTQGETATDVFYRLYLTVRDTEGLTGTTFIDLRPTTSAMTFRTNPANLSLTIDGQPVTTPNSTPTVAGVERTIGIVSPQVAGGVNYAFSNWAHGGGPTQTFGAPLDATTYTANFSSALTGAWRTTDVGKVNVPGSASSPGGVFTVSGSGTDIYGTLDNFRFVYQQAFGDVDIRARVASQSRTHAWAKAGIMIRQSTDPKSKNVFTAISPGNLASFQRRAASGGSTEVSTIPATVPYWVRLVRTGATFTSYVSADGTNWSVVGTPVSVPMNERVYVGMAVTSHNSTSLSTATFTNVSVSSPSTRTAEAQVREQYEVNEESRTDAGSFQVFPNPLEGDMLTVRFKNTAHPNKLQIINTLGKLIYETVIPENATDAGTDIDMAGMPAGIYLLRITAGSKAETRAVVKH